MHNPLQKLLVFLIRGYQWTISPWLGPRCRFYPTCSQYAVDAVSSFGVVRGSWLTILRLCQCHPFCKGGFDPVPKGKKENV